MNKKGFVLMETIVVITVLCVILVMLYGSYSNILFNVQKRSLYDNTEYIYKTALIRDHLEAKTTDAQMAGYNGNGINIICSAKTNACHGNSQTNNIDNDLYRYLNVEAIYITKWNTNLISSSDIEENMEPTTQKYIKYLDPTEINDALRIIVMYKDENNQTSEPIYQYASLRFMSRG